MARWYNKLLGKLNMTRSDVRIFLVSLLLAFGAWLMFNLSQSYSGILTVPVTASSSIDGRARLSSAPVMISARCRTKGYAFLRARSLSSGKPKVIELPPELFKYDGGDFYRISTADLGGYVGELFGEQVSLESFASSSVQFKFAEENHKKVPVRAVTSIAYKPQYMSAGPVRTDPDSVIVYGDAKLLANIDHVSTMSIILSDVSASRHGVIDLDVPQRVRVSQDEAGYSLDVTRFVELRRTVPVSVRNLPEGKQLGVYPNAVEVVLECTFPLSSDPMDDIGAYIDWNDFAISMTGSCIVHLTKLPHTVISSTIDPEVVECVEKASL